MAVTVAREDTRFENLKKSRNNRWPSTPADSYQSITICESGEDTAQAVQRIINAGQRPTIRSGGHCYEDFHANNPSGTLIDMGMMSYTGKLPHDQRYCIGPGATLGKVYQDLYKLYNVTLPGGTCSSVGAGGHITGGGYGYLSRLYGTSADWI